MKYLRVKKSHTVRINAAPDRVFPLLCPVREEKWLPGWKDICELIYSESGYNETGCVFRLHESFGEAVWTCLRFDPAVREVVFHVCVRDMMVYLFSIRLHETGEGTTDAVFEYVYTAISENGNEWIAHHTDETVREGVNYLGRTLEYFCRMAPCRDKRSDSLSPALLAYVNQCLWMGICGINIVYCMTR